MDDEFEFGDLEEATRAAANETAPLQVDPTLPYTNPVINGQAMSPQ